ncbi:hypothetical protein LTR36_008225 [Oleoguttula mirabilis]|uniref:RRM domain-containing protein n=1 Tax=Oleoguttula mirabilis TaxID=1507867 RepID=A0AAV9J885_9PEZI|nr:hypothetical protein LTR36_008225 [Oleoguttula mirabilis]
MSSPNARRSVSRGRTRTPAANIKTEDDAPMADAPNGARDHSRSRTRSRSASRARSRTRSPRDRSYSRSVTRSPTRSPSPSVPQSAKIVIEKLTKNVNEGHLREIFSTYGVIQELEMPMNRQFMMNKGIAYILYAEARYAESAIAHMHEAQLDGALINGQHLPPEKHLSESQSTSEKAAKPELWQQKQESAQVTAAAEGCQSARRRQAETESELFELWQQDTVSRSQQGARRAAAVIRGWGRIWITKVDGIDAS